MTMLLALERFCWWVNVAPCSILYSSQIIWSWSASPYEAPVTVTFCVFVSFLAGLSDIGRFDWCGPGPHEGSLSNQRQPHDAEHQHVVHSGAGTRWVSAKRSSLNMWTEVPGPRTVSFQPKLAGFPTDWHTCNQRGGTNEQNHLDMVRYCQDKAEWMSSCKDFYEYFPENTESF